MLCNGKNVLSKDVLWAWEQVKSMNEGYVQMFKLKSFIIHDGRAIVLEISSIMV